MKEPYVTIGILSGTTVDFELTGIFSTSDEKVVIGHHSVEIADSGLGILWNNKVYTTIEFTPSSYDGDTFELEGVTIGVDFHWERKENQRFRGSLKLIIDNGKIIAINMVKVEDYLISVISSEMKDTSSIPLLRAHSVISRSWLLKQMQSKNSSSYRKPLSASTDNEEIIRWWDHEDHSLFDVCADDHCQRYQGIGRVSGSIAAGAVADTRGLVLMHADKLCDARFSKCCGGVFERFESCWDDTPHPYLIPQRDYIESTEYPDLTNEEEAGKWIMTSPTSFCNSADRHTLSQVLNRYDLERNDFYRWTQHYSRQQLSTLIESRSGLGVGEVIDLIPLQRGSSGRIVKIRIVGTLRSVVIGKELMIRRTLSESHLLSSAFVVERHFDSDSTLPSAFTLHGAGWGHGVGLCQIGAAVMGEKGYSHEEILQHYYPGASIVKIY